jgi:hypothetical protein
MTRAASVNGISLTRRLTKVQTKGAMKGVAPWENKEGVPIREQEVIKCGQAEWERILASDPKYRKWAVVEFGSDVVAISPISKVGRPAASTSRN